MRLSNVVGYPGTNRGIFWRLLDTGSDDDGTAQYRLFYLLPIDSCLDDEALFVFGSLDHDNSDASSNGQMEMFNVSLKILDQFIPSPKTIGI
jgi:hypothetical protein